MVLKPSRFLNSLNPPTHKITTQNPDEDAEEFDERDIVWSSSSFDEPTSAVEEPTTSSAAEITITSPSTAAGLSAALPSSNEPPRGASSIQRKTTTSPVAMISPSLSGNNGSGSYYYGRKYHQSAPVNVPVWPSGFGRRNTGLGFDPNDGDIEDDGKVIPPHEFVARSQNSFSVFEGAGRTLKGRDLTRVRNAVFQKTGFLE